MWLRRSAFLLPAIVGFGVFTTDGCGGSKKAAPEDTGQATSNIGAPCFSDRNCLGGGTVCDKSHNVCVACTKNGDCSDGRICVDSSCVNKPECVSSKDCSAGVCDDSNHCVECGDDSDCTGGKRCVDKTCRGKCSKNEDCTEFEYCSEGACVRCMCEAVKNPLKCLEDSVMQCQGNCSGFVVAKQCVGACSSSPDPDCPGGTTEIGGGSGAGGGSGGGGGSDGTAGAAGGGTGGASVERGGSPGEGGQNAGGQVVSEAGAGGAGLQDAASEATLACDQDAAPLPGGDPCKEIPKFPFAADKQVVDGIGDEFCSIPARTMTVSGAGYRNPSDAQDSVSEATIRAAWSPKALHVHVHVEAAGPLYQDTGSIYGGDNVQFFVAGIKPTSADNNGKANGGANQILVAPPAGGNPTKSSVGDTGKDAPPTYQAAARAVSDGYEIEVKWTWADSAQIAVGKQIGFDVLVGVSNPDAGTRKLEYALQFAPLKSECSLLYCDAQAWCTPTLVQ